MKYFAMFEGIGGFTKGIEQSGIGAECIGYCEIDKYAEAIYKYHYPNHTNYGDATRIIPGKLPNFDLLTAGFPCQAFSIAGNRQGFKDTRGTLFFDIIRICKVKRPSYILLENVKGLLSHEKRRTITKIFDTLDECGYDVQWVVLNSKHLGVPQNRERIFIIGHLRGRGERKILFERKTSEKVDGVSGQSYNTLRARYKGGEGQGTYVIESKQYEKIDINGIPKKEQKVASILTGGGWDAKTGLYQIPRGKNKGGLKKECPTLSSSSFEHNNFFVHNMLPRSSKTGKGGTGHLTKNDGTVYCLDTGIVNAIEFSNSRIRRLTPIEAERLQGFSDNWTKYGIIDGVKVKISDTQRYKCCGNAVTVNVIEELIHQLYYGKIN